jgi:hypothetical protein
MTSQQQADAGLAIWQAHRHSPEIESLLDAFFNFPTSNEYERQQSCVTEIFSAKPIFTSDLPPALSAAL